MEPNDGSQNLSDHPRPFLLKNTKAPREKSSRSRSANVVFWRYLPIVVQWVVTATNHGSYRILIYRLSLVMSSRYNCCILGISSTRQHTSLYDLLHSSPFYLKGPWTAAKLGNPPKLVLNRNQGSLYDGLKGQDADQ